MRGASSVGRWPLPQRVHGARRAERRIRLLANYHRQLSWEGRLFNMAEAQLSIPLR